MEDMISVGDMVDVGVVMGFVINLIIWMVWLCDGIGVVLLILFS